MLSLSQLVEGTGISEAVAHRWLADLNFCMGLYDIKGRNRVSAFIAQIAHESGNFRYVREIWGPTKAQVRYEGRKDLGNTQVGDGKRYLGRGLIQITGRSNYRKLTAEIRLRIPDAPDFEVHPELLEEPKWASLSAACYWDWQNLNTLADKQAITRLSIKINGGVNGLFTRKRIWNRMLEALA